MPVAATVEKLTLVRLPLQKTTDKKLKELISNGEKLKPKSESDFIDGLRKSREEYKNGNCGDAWALAEEARVLIRNR